MKSSHYIDRLLCFLATLLLTASAFGAQGERIYLSGHGPSDAVEWDFFCSGGRRSGEWAKIPVPSNWEQAGFGGYNYGHDDPETKHDETGTYRTTFFAPEAWKEKHVRLVFEGAMTQTSIKVNGQSVGAPNYGGYTPFRYILDQRCLKYGEENTLEVLVKKKPDNQSLDLAERQADYWVFGGIYRPVYLEVLPKAFVNRLAIDARADGSLRLDVFPQVHHLRRFRDDVVEFYDTVVARVETRDGRPLGESMRRMVDGGAGRVRLNTRVDGVHPWSPESPQLYQVRVQLLLKGEVVHERIERFGFRTFEFREHDGLYLNGHKLLIQGINRNVFDPKHGRAIDAERVWREARAIKAMNANLVRSHMPPTLEFMRACDELGLLVISELCNWHDPAIDTPLARNIAYELVTTYQNHPSVILWANGNENGFNFEIDELYHLLDIQDRPVIHPWSLFEGIDTFHYPKYDELLARLQGPHVYLPTEFLHGLYDGGHGAGLADFWRAIRASPRGAGGVLWCWADAAVARTDMDGKLDTYGNKSADGIVGPLGEKEASYWTVREIWSPVQIPLAKLPAVFDGWMPIENRFGETSLEDCRFAWRLVRFPGPFSEGEVVVVASGEVPGPSVGPGESGGLRLPLPRSWREADGLELTAYAPSGRELMRWCWRTANDRVSVPEEKTGPRLVTDAGGPFEVVLGDERWTFSRETGQLIRCTIDGDPLGLGQGPVLYSATAEGSIEHRGSWETRASRKGAVVEIVARREEDGAAFTWTVSRAGVTLDYDFGGFARPVTYCAVGFDLPDKAVEGKAWLGRGPHRVWGNRMQGPQFGRWEDRWNDNVVGMQWDAPPFKGVFADVDWMRLDLAGGHSLLLDPDGAAAIGVLRPRNAEGPRDKNTPAGPVRAWWAYPESGGLYLFHKIPATGTKFANAERLGPQSVPARIEGPIAGRVTFHVREAGTR